MKLRTLLLLGLLAFAVAFAAFFAFSGHHREQRFRAALVSATTWQHMATPGDLSRPHAFLENNCAACHTAVKGVEANNCIVCHADNNAILQRQPTAFHADIAACAVCHQEHQGRVPSTTDMDHVALARIGLRRIQPAAKAHDPARDDLIAWIANGTPSSATAQLQREELLLNCAACHQTKDRHFGLFGNECAQCHGTSKWTVPAFRHPSPGSQSCAQCHQAPPSHYMMHFKMISMSIARMEKAEVSQCFLCHQTTSWNDIKGAGFYKHH